VPASAMHLDCNASVSTQQSIVSSLVISSTGSLQMEGCGKITVQVPSSAKGALALRYGVEDISNYASLPTQVTLRVLDASGHLLRKSIGLTYLGNGFQPIWSSVQGGSSVTFTMDGGNTNVQLAVAGISFLASAVAPHKNPDHQEFGSPSGGSIPIAPDASSAFATPPWALRIRRWHTNPCCATTTWPSEGCGTAELIMTDAHGSFSAKVGVADSNTDKTITAHLVVLDQNSKAPNNQGCNRQPW